MQIQTILDQIDLGAIALPEFQRGYVWNREQVRGLMWSLYKKHPVGSLLVWVTRTEGAPARGDYQQQIAALLREAEMGEDADERRRRELEARLQRLASLFEWGDIDPADYRARRAEVERELATLRPASDRAAWLAEAATFLRDIGAAWQAATPEERNDIAVTLFERVTVTGERIEEAIVRPEMAPFFILDSREDLRKRRDSNPRSRP